MTDIEKQFNLAEDLLEGLNFLGAFELYKSLLERLLHDVSLRRAPETALHIAVIERVAELALLCGQSLPAAGLLEAASATMARSGNSFTADWMAVKAASARLEGGDWSGARRSLAHLSPGLGEATPEFVAASLTQIERRWYWPDTSDEERASLVARLLLELGKQQSAQGQYRAAITYLEHSLRYCQGESGKKPLYTAILLELAATRLERGDLAGSSSALAECAPVIALGVIERIRHRELEARLALLQGQLGLARNRLEEVRTECRGLGLLAASANASLNLAHLFVLLNQTAEADRTAEEVEAMAEAASDPATALRARMVRRVALDRGQSLAEHVAITPPMTELWWAKNVPTAPGHSHSPVEEWPASRSFLDLFEVRALAFHWILSRSDWLSARRYLEGLDEVFGSTDSILIACRRVALEGLLLYYEEQWPAAAQSLTESDAGFAKLGIVFDRWQILRVRSWAKARTGDEAGATSDRFESEQFLEQMATSLSATERAVFRLNKWTQEEESLAHEVGQLEETRHATALRPAMARLLAWPRLVKATVALHVRIDDYRRGVSSVRLEVE